MDKKEYEQKMEKRLHDMDVEIGRMNAKADAAGADVRAGYQKEIRYQRAKTGAEGKAQRAQKLGDGCLAGYQARNRTGMERSQPCREIGVVEVPIIQNQAFSPGCTPRCLPISHRLFS